MKRRDIISITFAVIVFVISAGLIYRYFAPPTADNSIKVTVPHKVDPTFDSNQIIQLTNPALQDYTPDITPNFTNKTTLF